MNLFEYIADHNRAKLGEDAAAELAKAMGLVSKDAPITEAGDDPDAELAHEPTENPELEDGATGKPKEKPDNQPGFTPPPEDLEKEEAIKEYVGHTDDQHYYLVVADDGDLQVMNQESKMLLSAKEVGVDNTDRAEFLKRALQDLEIDYVTRNIAIKYLLPEEEPEEPEADDEVGEPKDAEHPDDDKEVVDEPAIQPNESKVNEDESPVSKTLQQYEDRGFEGMDASLEVSLYDQGLIWKETEGSPEVAKAEGRGEYLFIYGVGRSTAEDDFDRFDYGYYSEEDLGNDVQTFINVEDVAKTSGMTPEEWLKAPLPNKVFDLIMYYGHENIFGSPSEGYEILKDEPMDNLPAGELGEAKTRTIKESIEVEDDGHTFNVSLVDDGTMDTVISINGKEFRFDSEFASYWRDDDGELDDSGLMELARDALANMEPEEYEELVGLTEAKVKTKKPVSEELDPKVPVIDLDDVKKNEDGTIKYITMDVNGHNVKVWAENSAPEDLADDFKHEMLNDITVVPHFNLETGEDWLDLLVHNIYHDMNDEIRGEIFPQGLYFDDQPGADESKANGPKPIYMDLEKVNVNEDGVVKSIRLKLNGILLEVFAASHAVDGSLGSSILDGLSADVVGMDSKDNEDVIRRVVREVWSKVDGKTKNKVYGAKPKAGKSKVEEANGKMVIVDVDGEKHEVGPGVNLSGKDLGGVNLTGVDLSGAILQRTNLHGTILTNANLSGADLSFASSIGTDFVGANLSGANLSNADLRAADFSNADVSEAVIKKASLIEATLVNANFSGAVLSNSNLYTANLNGADFSGAALEEVNLRSTHAIGTNFEGANLTNADCFMAKLINANFLSANTDGTDFTGARMNGAKFDDVAKAQTKIDKRKSRSTRKNSNETVIERSTNMNGRTRRNRRIGEAAGNKSKVGVLYTSKLQADGWEWFEDDSLTGQDGGAAWKKLGGGKWGFLIGVSQDYDYNFTRFVKVETTEKTVAEHYDELWDMAKGSGIKADELKSMPFPKKVLNLLMMDDGIGRSEGAKLMFGAGPYEKVRIVDDTTDYDEDDDDMDESFNVNKCTDRLRKLLNLKD